MPVVVEGPLDVLAIAAHPQSPRTRLRPPAEHLTRPDVDLDFLDDRHTLPLLTVHVQRAIAAQGEHMQWIEGRLAAARAIASYLASYPAEHTGRQIGWIAQALTLSAQTFSAEVIDAYRRQTPHSATETLARHPQPALTIAR